jgi:hypothetical protein
VGCTRRVVAGCNIDACPISNGGTSDAGLPMASPHAGGLTFSGVGVDVKISLQPDALGRYAPAGPPASGPAFLGGEAAKLVATGGEIPAFEIDTMYPLLLVLDKPAATVGQVLAPRTQDLSVVWSRGAPDVLFYLRGTSGDLMKPLSIGCLVASTDGSLTLPTAELSQFSAGTTFTLATFSKKSARAGQYAVDMYLGGEIVSPDRQYAVEIMLE